MEASHVAAQNRKKGTTAVLDALEKAESKDDDSGGTYSVISEPLILLGSSRAWEIISYIMTSLYRATHKLNIVS